MSRLGVLVSITAVLLLSVAAMAAGLGGGPAAASPQPTPFCPVCGQTFHENVTATDATLQVTGSGDVEWRVENELTEPTASEWRENPEAAASLASDAVDRRYRPPYDPTDPTVTVDGDTLVVEFVDRGAARQRLGLFVVPYLHGEGREPRWVVNADRFSIVGPEGMRVVDEPAGADVDGDRAVWHGDTYRHSAEPEPGDTYVVFGSGPAVDARASVAVALMPLDPGLYGAYLLGLAFLAGGSYGIYAVAGTRLGPRRVVPVLAAVSLPYLFLIGNVHPPGDGLGGGILRLFVGLVTVVLALAGGAILYTWAAVAGREDDPS